MLNISVNDCWSRTLELLKNEITSVPYDTWIKPLKPLELNETTFIVETIDSFYKKMIEDRYSRMIKIILRQVLEKEMNLIITIPDESKNIKQNNNIIKNNITIPDPTENSDNDLIPRYVFDNFVVGNSNRMAHAAAVAVADAPGEAYNPLFLYGGVGLGKTHLMHAIAHYILEQNSSAKVLYASCEKFTNELITSIKENKNNEFREKYRKIDVLLIDDIQFITDKISTQEEFFHTFNSLWLARKQIIISSDRPPREIQTLTDRLRSRFEGGLIADIKLPDFETRTAILEKKAELDNLIFPKEVFQFIAQTVKSNIRELEGALNRVIAYANLANRQVNVQLAEEALKDIMVNLSPEKLSIEYIQQAVADYYNIEISDIKGKRRNQPIVKARQVAMYLCRQLLSDSLSKIGSEFGGRDHSTVIHACEKINTLIDSDDNLRDGISYLEKKLIKY